MPDIVGQPARRTTTDAIAEAVAHRHDARAGQRHIPAEREVGAQAGRGERHRAVVGDRADQRRDAVGRANELAAGETVTPLSVAASCTAPPLGS